MKTKLLAMDKIILPVFLFFLTISTLSAQNLVGNPGFESFTSLPTSYGQYSRAVGWTNCGGSGTSDYYHTSGSVGTSFGPMTPNGGNAQMGFLTRHSTAGVAMEYVCRTLNSPMVIGQDYEVSFFVTQGNGSGLYTSSTGNIGALFTVGPAVQSGGAHINMTPQVEQTAIVSVTNAWQQLSFTHTPTSAYNHISIGNFNSFAATAFTGADGRAYYYVDDVVVQPIIILDVNALNFEVEKQDEKYSLLSWSIDQAEEVHRISIQRSPNGVEYENIAIDLLPEQLQYLDQTPFQGDNYYRLRIEMLDGSIAYSEVRTLNYSIQDISSITRVFPNPFSDYLVVDIQNSGSQQGVEIRLVNMLGQIVHSENHQLANVRFKIELSPITTQLAAGTYQVQILSDNGWKQQHKVVKY